MKSKDWLISKMTTITAPQAKTTQRCDKERFIACSTEWPGQGCGEDPHHLDGKAEDSEWN